MVEDLLGSIVALDDQLVFAFDGTATWPVLVAEMGEIWSLSVRTLINRKRWAISGRRILAAANFMNWGLPRRECVARRLLQSSGVEASESDNK
jgi:hypothetical protein